MHLVNMVSGSSSFHLNSLKEANCSKCFCIGGFSLKKTAEFVLSNYVKQVQFFPVSISIYCMLSCSCLVCKNYDCHFSFRFAYVKESRWPLDSRS